MAWNTTAPDGSQSVKANNSILQDNTTYIETTMGNSAVGVNTTSTRDHFWNVGVNQDGRHRFVQSPAFTVGGSPADPVVGTGMSGVSYLKKKSSADAVDFQPVAPFFKDAQGTANILEMMGMRACCVFNVSGGTVTVKYAHNINPATGITRSATGIYTATFTTALPSENYLVLGDFVRNSASPSDVGVFTMSGSTSLSLKTTTSFTFRTFTLSGNPVGTDPVQCWFVCFGG